MGFYGNIKSTNKTQFTFDRIYPNRKTMDEAANAYHEDSDGTRGDGVFIGRFVLVDYEDGEISGYFPIFKKTADDNDVFYADSACNIIMTTALCKKNDIFQYQAGSTIELWQATGNSNTTIIDDTEVEYATFVRVTDSKYEANYKLDIDTYGPGRGYDGTVWQKVFTEGKEKYVMIAELNSVVPTFKITADAPTMKPLPPHFDKQSNNVAYWLHVQPQWGFRVKEASSLATGEMDDDGNPIYYSDEEVTWITNNYNEVNQTLEEPIEETVHGDIYFNKAGLSKEIKSYVTSDKGDIITVTPTGVSGNKYLGHGDTPKEEVDIQEISIILPSIGNAISEAWDVVYGAPQNEDNKRNLDIKWDSLKGIRMVEEGLGGYKYNTESVESLGGCINSVHDLMGMIIVGESPDNAKDADANSIYYDTKAQVFKRKHTTYEYSPVDAINNDNSYQPVPGSNLLKYEAGKYFYKDSLDNYYLEKAEKPDKSRNYYDLGQPKPQPLEEKYLPDTWYYKNGGDYLKAVEEEAVDSREYLIISDDLQSTIIKWFRPEAYFYTTTKEKPTDLSQITLVQPTDKYNKDLFYWGIYNEDIGSWKTTSQNITINGVTQNIVGIEWPDDYNTPEKALNALYQVQLTPFEENKFYIKREKDYILVRSQPLAYNSDKFEDAGFYYLIETEIVPPFYEADKYHFKNNDDYLADRVGKFDSEKVYYKLESQLVTKSFFIEGEYYENINDPTISEDTEPNSDKEYLERMHYYVYKDDEGILPIGAEWNEKVTDIPSTIKLATRKEIYEMQELEGFARSFNTIHGLILEIRKLLDTGHAYTRDINTVQGAINKLKDIIAKFDDLQPGNLVLVDNYGRINPTEVTDDDWVLYTINTEPANTSITFEHSEAHDAITTISQGNKNPKFGETITTPEVAIDEKGHVSSVKNEDIVLPKPSLTTNGSGVLTSASLVEEDGALTANYTALSDVKLDGYGKTTATGDILSTDSLETGLSKLENAIAFTNDALEEVDAQLREDFAAEDTAIRSEFAAADTAIRTDLGNRITAIENKNDFGVGALTTRVEANENKLNGVDSVKNSLDALDSRIAAFEQGDSSTLGGLATQVENINSVLNQKVACSVRGFEGDTAYALQTTTGIVQLENFIINTNNVFKTKDEDGVYSGGVVCPYDGVVLISCSLYYNTNVPSRRGVYIKKNADEIASYYGSTYDFPGSVHSGIIIVPVLAGDVIRVAGRTDTDEMLELLLDNSGTHLDIVYL